MKSVYVSEIVTYSDSLKVLLNAFSDLFTDTAGEINGLKAELYLEKDAIYIFCKATTVTYALRAAVNEELQRKKYEGIIKPVTNSKWATSIIPVVNTNGKNLLCGDYNRALNKFQKV